MWLIKNSGYGVNKSQFEEPGDYLVADDGRAVYTVAADKSYRRVKDKAVIKAVQERWKELKAQYEESIRKEAARRKELSDLARREELGLVASPQKLASVLATLGAAGGPAMLRHALR